MAQIIFYDIPNQASAPQARAWSPNTWRTRYAPQRCRRSTLETYRLALGFKGIPFKTVWVEYPDIADLCTRIGAGPTDVNPDGTPYYSLPVIQDLSTGKVVSDSWAIARYLDATYPERPLLLPPGTAGLQRAFIAAAAHVAVSHYGDSVLLPTCAQLRPRSTEYFRRTREADFGCTMEAISAGQTRVDAWKKARDGFSRIKGWIEENGEGSRWIMGDVVSYADLVLAAWTVWVRQVKAAEWENVSEWDDGFWIKFVQDLEERYAVWDEGEEYSPRHE